MFIDTILVKYYFNAMGRKLFHNIQYKSIEEEFIGNVFVQDEGDRRNQYNNISRQFAIDLAESYMLKNVALIDDAAKIRFAYKYRLERIKVSSILK